MVRCFSKELQDHISLDWAGLSEEAIKLLNSVRFPINWDTYLLFVNKLVQDMIGFMLYTDVRKLIALKLICFIKQVVFQMSFVEVIKSVIFKFSSIFTVLVGLE